MSPSQPFPPLPIEITIAIVEAAATTSLPTALALSVVSKSIHRWTKPILYNAVHLSWHNLSRFRNGFFSHNFSYYDTSHFQKSHTLIRNLFITDCSGPAVLHIVNRCDSLDRLLCDIDIIECTTTKSRPREVVIYPSSHTYTLFRDGDVPPTVIQRVTHLFVKRGVLDEKFIQAIVSLEYLTHLGLSFGATMTEEQVVPGVERLLAMSSLKLILVVSSTALLKGQLWRDLAAFDDERLIVCSDGVAMDPIDVVIRRGSMWGPGNINRMRRWRMFVY